MASIFEGPAFIFYLVKKLQVAYPDKQIGKNIIQNLIYLSTREGIDEYDYSLYHYGPYSVQVSYNLSFAKELGLIQIDWVSDKGYFITATKTELTISNKEKEILDKVIMQYGMFSAIELSTIATALYVKDKFNVNDNKKLLDIILSLKPSYEKDWIIDTICKIK